MRKGADVLLQFDQPPWREPIWFSRIVQGMDGARLPNLVVCAAVNVSRDVPPGRLAGSFTFERAWEFWCRRAGRPYDVRPMEGPLAGL